MIHTIVDPPAEYFFDEDLNQAGHAGSVIPVPAALEKTRMCVYYLQGRCKYDDCSFAHSTLELKQAPSNLRKTKMCDLFMMGHCFDTHCNFAHSVDEIKVRPKRSMSLTLSPSLASSTTNLGGSSGFDKETYNQNTEFCARTILLMLIQMQPEAAVAFLSNPECKLMLERLLEETKPSSNAPITVPADDNFAGLFLTPSGSTSVGSLSPNQAGGLSGYFDTVPQSPGFF
jgi:hypothetical protein